MPATDKIQLGEEVPMPTNPPVVASQVFPLTVSIVVEAKTETSLEIVEEELFTRSPPAMLAKAETYKLVVVAFPDDIERLEIVVEAELDIRPPTRRESPEA